MAAPVILVEAAPRKAADGGSVTVRLAGRGANVPYRYGGQHWRAGIVDLPTIVTSLDFDGGNPGGGGVPQALELRWAPAGNARLADLARYYWADAPITVRVGPEGDAMPPVLLSGTVLDSTVEGGVLRIAMADPAAGLKKPLLTARALGTGGIEGPADFEGLLLARTWGRCFNVVGRPWDPANNIWCFGDPRRRLQAFDAVRDMGAAAAALTPLAWQGSAEATFAALQAAQAPNGGGVIAPDIACVKWWTVPGGDLCADIRGEIEGGYVETAPEIAARIASSRSALTFAAGTIAAAKAARPAVFGWRVEDESTTAADALSQILGEVSTSWLLTAGEIELRPWSWGAPVAAAHSHAVSRREVQKPVSTRRLGYRRNWHPMARGDLAAIVLATEVSFGDGTTLEQLKPATPGATAGAPSGTTVGGTIQPDGSIVGGVPADDIAELPDRVDTVDGKVILIQDDVAAVQGDIAELFEVYSHTIAAEESAQIAQQASGVAVSVARDALPSDFRSDGKYWFWAYEGDPATRTDLVAPNVTFPTVAGLGKVARVVPAPNSAGLANYDIGQKGLITLAAGRRYRISVDYSMESLGNEPELDVWAIGLNASYAYVNGAVEPHTPSAVNVRYRASVEVAADTLLALGCVYLRAMVRTWRDGAYRLITVESEDITESNAAGSSAAVATLQAAAASGSAAQASTTQQLTARTVAALVPKTLVREAFTLSPQYLPLTQAPPLPPSDFVDGVIVKDTSTSPDPYTTTQMAPLPFVVGRTYRVNAKVEWVSGWPNQPTARFYAWLYDASGNVVGSTLFGAEPTLPANQTVDMQDDFFCSSGFPQTTAFVRFSLLTQRKPGDVGNVFAGRSNGYAFYTEDVTSVVAAGSSAGIATDQAVISTEAAAAARTSMTVAASVASGSLNKNGIFADYPSPSMAIPPSWLSWGGNGIRTYGNGDPYNDGPSIEGSPWGFQQASDGVNGAGIMQEFPAGQGSYVYSGTVQVRTGTGFSGAGILLYFLDINGNWLGQDFINFATDPDIAGVIQGRNVGAGTQIYRWTKYIKVGNPAVRIIRIYAMTSWVGFDGQDAAKTLSWLRCSIRTATAPEIAAQKASTDLAALSASVSINTGAIADINGSAAFLEQIVAAGDGNPAIFRMLAGKGGSGIWLLGDRIIVGNPLPGGQWAEVARFEDGQAKLNNALIRNLLVIPNPTANLGFPVELAPRIFLATDGQVVTYPASIGSPAARIEADTSGIAVPAGSSLDVRAINSTAGGFTARAKIIGSPTYANQTASGGANVGGTPAWQMDKPTVADAYNGLYQVNAQGTLTRTSYYREGPGQWVGSYSGVMSFYVNTGSGFVFVGAVDGGGEFPYTTVPPETIPNAFTGTFQFNGAIGAHGGKEFGVSGPITAFHYVTYTTLNAASETPITQNIPFKVYPARN